MSEQLLLEPFAPGKPELTLEELWEVFAGDNAHLEDAIVHVTRELLALRGTSRIGIAAVWEELRYRTHTTGEPYRLDNDLRAPAARWIMERHPELDGVYPTRRSKADR